MKIFVTRGGWVKERYRWCSNRCCVATTPETLNHVLDDGGDSGAVHGVVDAVGRSHGLDLGDEVGVIAEESVGGTELGRQMQSRLLQVDGDDGPGSSHPGGHDGAHADRACPKDGNRLPGLHVERVEDGSRARLQAAAERCEQRQISVVGDLYETRCGHDGVSREGALPEEAAVEGLAALFLVLMHDARPIGPFAAEVERHERVAVGRVSVFALGAALAVGEGEQDLVARGYVLDLGADFFDYAAAYGGRGVFPCQRNEMKMRGGLPARSGAVPSCPSTAGAFAGRVPSAQDRSVWQRPLAWILTSASVGRNGSNRIVSKLNGPLISLSTNAIEVVMMAGSAAGGKAFPTL